MKRYNPASPIAPYLSSKALQNSAKRQISIIRRLPAAERHLSPQSSHEQSALPKRVRVLVVDDERDTVTTLTELLADEGYQVRGVYKGRDAVNAMRDFEPEVVLIDLAMPDMSGWEVARQIRSRHGERPFLIAITGRYKQPSDKMLGTLAGFNHQLEKPCEPKTLISLLSGLDSPDR
jgi:CheY-like chemotaxis protein